jgi:hypothetical protein
MSIKKYLIFGCGFLLPIGSAALNGAVQPGFLEGHLKIVSPKTVDLADGNAPTVTTETYAEYLLIILSRDEKKEVARVTADKNGNYRVALPPGDYLLDLHGRARGHARAKVQPFTIISNQTSRADMDLDTGIR